MRRDVALGFNALGHGGTAWGSKPAHPVLSGVKDE